MTVRALLLDLDGTILDTNEIHVEAWAAALAAHGYRVGRDRILHALGDDHAFVSSVLGPDTDRAEGHAIRNAKSSALRRRLVRPLRLVDGARGLIDAARARGLRTLLVTSLTRSELHDLRTVSGERVADLADDVVPAELATSPVGPSEALRAACATAGEEPLACALVSHSLRHARSARGAGISFIAVASDYANEESFARSGARFVAPNAAALASSLGDALERASRLRVPLDAPAVDRMMEPALAAAGDALSKGEAPVGAAIFSRDGELLATGHNRACETGDRTLHAEIDGLHAVARKGRSTDDAAILVSTLEPCVMCFAAAMEVGIDVVIFGLESPDDGGLDRVQAPKSPENLVPRVRSGVRRHAARELFVRWLREVATPHQRPFAEALLAQTATPPGAAGPSKTKSEPPPSSKTKIEPPRARDESAEAFLLTRSV